MVATLAGLEPDIDPEILQALGAVMVRFAVVEVQLRVAIGALLFRPIAGPDAGLKMLILIAEMSFQQQINAFHSLHLQIYSKDAEAERKSLCKRLNDAAQRRNQLIHSQWESDRNSTGKAIRVKITADRLWPEMARGDDDSCPNRSVCGPTG